MDQEKIGKFIANCRKKKNITQKEFAVMLGVTDKTVSRWENGHYMPDISLFEKICEILEINIYELLHGEKIEQINRKEVDNTIMNIVNLSKTKINQNKKKILIATIIFIILFTVSFNVLYKKIDNKKSANDIIFLPTLDIPFPTKYSQIEKEDGWVCSFTLEYLHQDLTTPNYYQYQCDNLKNAPISNDKLGYQESDSINHYSYLHNKEYKKEIIKINDYFVNNKINSVITLDDLEDLDINLIDKKELIELFNIAINSKMISKKGNYINDNKYEYLTTSLKHNNSIWQLGYIQRMGNIMYVNIDFIKGNQYLSDLVKNNKANDSERKLYENIIEIEKYILENQKFILPQELSDIEPYKYLVENFNEIEK